MITCKSPSGNWVGNMGGEKAGRDTEVRKVEYRRMGRVDGRNVLITLI